MASMSREKAQTNQPFCRWGVSIGQVLDLRQRAQRVHEDVGVPPPPRHVPVVHPVELRQADGRLHLRHAVVPADAVVDVGQLLLQASRFNRSRDVVAVVAEAAGFPGEVFVVGRDHAPLAAGGEGLVLAEAARRHAPQRARLPAAVRAAEGLGIVFDHRTGRVCGRRRAIRSMSQTLP